MTTMQNDIITQLGDMIKGESLLKIVTTEEYHNLCGGTVPIEETLSVFNRYRNEGVEDSDVEYFLFSDGHPDPMAISRKDNWEAVQNRTERWLSYVDMA